MFNTWYNTNKIMEISTGTPNPPLRIIEPIEAPIINSKKQGIRKGNL